MLIYISLAVMSTALLVSTSSIFSIVILAIESNNFVRCLATICGWSPLDRISSRSAEEAK